MAKLKNSNCDKTQKKKLCQNLKDQIVTKLKNSNCAKLKKIKLWQLKNSNCDSNKNDSSDILLLIITYYLLLITYYLLLLKVVIMTSFSKKHLNTLTTDQLSGQLFATLAMFNCKMSNGEGFGRAKGFGAVIFRISTTLGFPKVLEYGKI